MTLPPEVARFAEGVLQVLREELDADLVGVYVVGSAALGDLQPTSDLDMAAVAADDMAEPTRRRLTQRLLDAATNAPVRGLELVVYTAAQAANPDGSVALNVNAGPGMATQVGVDDEFWFAIDTSILRQTAIALHGPPAEDVFGAVPRDTTAAALDASLVWHRDHGDRPHATVLTACRAWRYLSDGRWSSKSDAARWAVARAPEQADLIALADAVRRGAHPGEVDAAAAKAFAATVRDALA